MPSKSRLVDYTKGNRGLNSFMNIQQDITDNSRGLNRFPDAPLVNHPDGIITGHNTVNQYPEWWHRSNNAKFTKGYYHPKSLRDSVYRNKAGPVQENTDLIRFNNWHKYRDPFYNSSGSKNELWKSRPGENVGNDRIVSSLVAKNTIRPKGYKRSYIPTKEELTGEKMLDNWNISSAPRARNVTILNTFHGRNRKVRKLPQKDGRINNRLNTTQNIYKNTENLGMKPKVFIRKEKDRNIVGDSTRNIRQPINMGDIDRGKNSSRNNPGVFMATRKGQHGGYVNGGVERMNVNARTTGGLSSRKYNNPDYNPIKRPYIGIKRPSFADKVRGAVITPDGIRRNFEQGTRTGYTEQNREVRGNRIRNNREVEDIIDRVDAPILGENE